MSSAVVSSPITVATYNLPTFLLSAAVLLYLSTFVLFAVLRIITGVSIQRVGYLSLKRIAFEPRDDVKLEIRKLGLLLHRPTFTAPTWVSIVVQDSHVTLGLRKQEEESENDDKATQGRSGRGAQRGMKSEDLLRDCADSEKTKLIDRIRRLRDSLKKLHSWIRWMRLVDVVVTNTTITASDVASVQIGSLTMMVDARRETAQRNRLFDHCSNLGEGQPLEWVFAAKSVLFMVDKKDPVELLDHCIFNVYGVLESDVKELRDLALAFKFGRITLPYDELLGSAKRMKGSRRDMNRKLDKHKGASPSMSAVMEEVTMLGSRTERMTAVVMESKEFLQGFLKSVKEIQFAIGYLLISKEISNIQPTGRPLKALLGLKELGIDVHQLDQRSPEHRMYFSPKDIAHQALLAAISVTVSLNDGVRQDRILYIPMVTMTSRTTLFSKTIQIVESSESDRNANILFANMVITSPSVDLKPRHLPVLVAMVQSRPQPARSQSARRAHLMSRLLPKASIKFSIQEPVMRIVLPPTEPEFQKPGEMDMLVSSLSSISIDMEASHDEEAQSRYTLSSVFRITSHDLYYRTASGIQHELLQTETFDMKTELSASPEVQVVATAYLSSFALRLVRPEIVQGLKQMVGQFQRDKKPDKLRFPESPASPNLLRRIPLWLEHFKIECNDYSIEIAGVDSARVSEIMGGAALQVDNWIVEYKCKRGESNFRPAPRRRAASRTISKDETKKPAATKPTPYAKDATDGRKLTFHARGLECYIIDGEDSCEPDAFLRVPHFDLGFSTANDIEGPVLHISSFSKSFHFNYSLYRHYCVLAVMKVLREAFGAPSVYSQSPRPGKVGDLEVMQTPLGEFTEFIGVDIKVQYVQIKASMPNDPPMMFEIHGLDTGRHRWGFPFLKARHFRLYAESPKVKKHWARLVSMKHFRLDLRQARKRLAGKFVDEKSIDISADAIRLAIPHQLTLYRITDNVINTIKASQQMHHRFKTGTNEYILEKTAQGPKHVPRVTLKTKALLLELEDDPFETQLGLIYRAGLLEQKKRLAREAAFDAKARKMEEEHNQRKPWEATRAATEPRLRGRTRTWRQAPSRAASLGRKRRSKSAQPADRNMRYDPASAAAPSGNASVSIEEARERLQEHNSVAWIRRIRWVNEQHKARISEAREMFWGHDDMPTDSDEPENILGLPMRPALMAGYFNDVSIVIDKPSFPLSELPRFLHRVGKGLPEDTLFALLVPLSIKLDFSEAKAQLRDYPLPFIHVPQMKVGQAQRLPSWSLQADFVLAEELRGPESIRHAQVNIVPPTKADGIHHGGFAIDVRRTVSAVKSYSDVKVSINTSYATRITWCTAYQPVIQDMMMVFETFTKPHVDPSERTGFWDKIRLILHSQISLAWEGGGDVHLALKGSRDPYKVTGDGAGFVMCWRGDVRWDLGRDEDPRKFVKVDSEEYLLAIPDFSSHITEEVDIGAAPDAKSILSTDSFKNGPQNQKVIMKLAGRVRWLVGLMFEQEISAEDDWKLRKRSFEFKPHYEVTLKSPQYAKAPPGEVYDAFRGFRSHHLHLSLAIVSPIERDWAPSDTEPPPSYNAIHLTPKFFTHFFAWWSLFSGVMSLPIRQGALWPGPEKSNKKFGRHLATIKYKLCLSPLFISHIYKYHDKDENNKEIIAATGLKTKLDTFLLDIHQRREEVLSNLKSTSMKINQAELDFHSADIRAVHAVLPGETLEELMNQAIDGPDYLAETIRYAGDMSQFTIADDDYTWVDMDDFVELDWASLKNKTPKTKIMPLAYAPRFTYFRQTDHSEPCSCRSMSPFGNEASHDCIMSLNNDPREIQCALVQARLEQVNQQMSRNKEAIESLAQHTKLNPDDLDLKAESERLIQQSSILFNMREFLQTMLRRISSKLDEGDKNGGAAQLDAESSADSDLQSEPLGMDGSPFADYVSDFDNRFIVHNMQAKWSNQLRNIILKYIHQVGQRRGFVYYMSRRAIKFILDIIEEQKLSGQKASSGHTGYQASGPFNTEELADNDTLESRIQQLLDDEVKVVTADEKQPGLDEFAAKLARDDLTSDVADEYVALNSYHVRLIAPQIQMQSEKNKAAAVLVAAQGMQLKVVSVMDRERVGDEVSGLVQRRFALNLDNTQFFVSHHQDFVPQSMSLHSANRYGAPSGSVWPPWVPLESMFDFRHTPVGFSRVVERTSATLRYDKHNSLRLKYSDQVSGLEARKSAAKKGPQDVERRIDCVWVDFPGVEASCDSNQYFAMYIIVLDLLLYAEPAEKVRSEKLEKIMLASDFSDLTGAPEMVECLQNRIGQLTEIKHYFMLNAHNLDSEGWQGKLTVGEDLANCEDELFFMMKAITTAQRKYEDRSSQSSGIVRWYITASDIIWHMLRSKGDPLMDMQLQNAAYERVDNADGSNFNTIEVETLRGYNLLPDALYPEMIAPFFGSSHMAAEGRRTMVLRIYWNMLEAIAGIPVMDHFEVNLFPLKIQLEREIGERIFEYIFPGSGKNAFDGGFSPFLAHKMKPLANRSGESSSDDGFNIEGPVVDDASSASDVSGMDLHLRPTVVSPNHRPKSAHSDTTRPKTSSASSLLQYWPNRSVAQKPSNDSLLMSPRRSTEGPTPSLYVSEKGKNKMQLFNRSRTGKTEQRSDELSQMISRASNYMTLAYIKIPSVVLCLSYKGRADKNIEDIHELVFKMPMLEYRNKTWSNLDLAMRLKKDIMRALLSHTGTILQNKLTHHRPDKPQTNMLRMMANNGSLGTASGRPGTALESSYSSVPSRVNMLRPATAAPSGRFPALMVRNDTWSTSTPASSGNQSTRTLSSQESQSPADGDDKSSGKLNVLGRHLTHLAVGGRNKDSIAEDEESIKKKTRLLLGKKVFSSF